MKVQSLVFLLLLVPVLVHAQSRNLDYYLEQAVLNSPLINKSKNDQELIQLDLKQINAVLSKPEINIESNILFAPIIAHDNGSNRFKLISGDANNYTGYDLAATDGGQYQAMVTYQQSLFGKARIAPYETKASVDCQISANQIKLTKHELKQLVSYQYLLCWRSKMQIENGKAILETMHRQVELMQLLVDQAIYQQTDLMLLKIDYKGYQLGLANYEDEYKSNFYDLNILCGIQDTTLGQLEALNILPSAPAITTSEFTNSFRLDSLNILADLKISELKYKPQLNWYANAGLNAVYLPTPNRFGLSTGLTFSWNIFDGHQRKIQQDMSLIQLNSLEFDKQYLLKQIQSQKSTINQKITSVNQRIALVEEQLADYDQILAAYSLKLMRGDLSIIEFKSLFQEIALKKQELIGFTVEKMLLMNSYNYWNY